MVPVRSGLQYPGRESETERAGRAWGRKKEHLLVAATGTARASKTIATFMFAGRLVVTDASPREAGVTTRPAIPAVRGFGAAEGTRARVLI